MSDRMTPISFDKLMNWIIEEYAVQQSVFGVRKIYRHSAGGAKLSLFGETLETPFGPAAGPHTQLAQNIIAAYVAGARFFELKTVQTLDGEDLPVAKPCINALDEGYNVEWSTELRVPEAMEEYIKAWFAIKLLSRELGLGSDTGFIFNMSVGYDLQGIKSPKIDAFIEGLKDASHTDIWNRCKQYALANLGKFKNVNASFIYNISPKICSSITLSTLHGCPPAEIERIATYLLQEKKLNTYIKCNPTLLGYDFARKTMDDLGYDYLLFDDHHFKSDLQIEDAIPMIERLLILAKTQGLDFGVKLTNTFPVDIGAKELPGEEMYLSGRALYPLTISVAKLLSEAFEGTLRISYSGGADAYNIEPLFTAGIWPITLATTLLKPGGYARLNQLAVLMSKYGDTPFTGVDVIDVTRYAEKCLTDPYYHKPIKPQPERKLAKKLPLMDCFTAPCQEICPIGQDIPAYMRLVGEGKYLEALQVIMDKNPLPFITGTICPHSCMNKCTRSFYEGPVQIRDAKLLAAEKAYAQMLADTKPPERKKDIKVAIVGGGPAGIAAAYFLAKAGADVTIFEKRDSLGGITRHAIPDFRITPEAVAKDIAFITALGVKVELNTEKTSADELKIKGYTYVIFAVGAWKSGSLALEQGQAMSVLEFLETYKRAYDSVKLGDNVVIVGGGNTAMDAARAAKRARGVKNVYLVYRRTKRYMPADEEELRLAMEDGVEICELLAPVAVKWRKFVCSVMELGEPDESGRRSPVDTGRRIEIAADTVISAIGETIDKELFLANKVTMDDKGKPKVNPKTMETIVKHIYAIGDARRGASTVVEAIADARKVAEAIIGAKTTDYTALNLNTNYGYVLDKKGLLYVDSTPHKESERCLECSTVCECCVDVCPNRANLSIKVQGKAMNQILHIDGMCNECGNCESFCPYEGAPYKDKFTLFWSEKDFQNSTNEGFVLLEAARQRYLVRTDKKVSEYTLTEEKCGLHPDLQQFIKSAYAQYRYLF